ncbi:hypothetical protein VITFI_CDS1741 [Vitreoscilla filiformis]|uniref:Uncharacterized protein n=1 Tax=Vitreoscilla filiformis TaxID=63 RepID=A0A221KEZ1_VITFI|nr:hypothetical protein VITFI_CDS1741 [Vitreoscilla filiformis]
MNDKTLFQGNNSNVIASPTRNRTAASGHAAPANEKETRRCLIFNDYPCDFSS